MPFFGHLKMKRYTKITKKLRKKKSNILTRNNQQLSYFERRLDVIVFRLNLAPNIFWARQLIQTGAVYVSSIKKWNIFEKMHAPLKKEIYPLKLRDPKNLYKKTRLSLNFYSRFAQGFINNATNLHYFLEPLYNINYRVEPGEIILCAPGSILNKFKTNSLLWKKPIPNHLMTLSSLNEAEQKLKSRTNKIKAYANIQNNFTNISFLLFHPTFSDLHKKDRINKSFMRWLSL